MPRTLTSSFTTADWNEADIEGAPGTLRHTTVHYGVTYIGEVAGSGTLDFLMVYKNERSVDYIGYEFFDGTIGPHSGSLVFEHRGAWAGDAATSDLTVVPDTATGDLAGLTIIGKMHAPHEGNGTLMLSIEE